MAKKSIDEAIRRFTPEEWRNMIEEEMEFLGLYYGEEKEDYESLFSEEDS